VQIRQHYCIVFINRHALGLDEPVAASSESLRSSFGYTAQFWLQPFAHRHACRCSRGCFGFSEFRSPMSPRF